MARGRKSFGCQSNLDIGGNKGFRTFFMFLIYSEGLQEAFKISLMAVRDFWQVLVRTSQGSNYSFALRKLRSDFRFWRRKRFFEIKNAKQNF